MAIYKNIEGTPELFGNVNDGLLDLRRVTSENYQFEPVSSGISKIDQEFVFRYDKITGIQIVMFTTNPVSFNAGWNLLARCEYDQTSREEYVKAIRPRAAYLGLNGVGFYELFCPSGSELFDAGAYVIPKYDRTSDSGHEYMEISMYCENNISIQGHALTIMFNAMLFNNFR